MRMSFSILLLISMKGSLNLIQPSKISNGLLGKGITFRRSPTASIIVLFFTFDRSLFLLGDTIFPPSSTTSTFTLKKKYRHQQIDPS